VVVAFQACHSCKPLRARPVPVLVSWVVGSRDRSTIVYSALREQRWCANGAGPWLRGERERWGRQGGGGGGIVILSAAIAEACVKQRLFVGAPFLPGSQGLEMCVNICGPR
jgi:hypothetical protein